MKYTIVLSMIALVVLAAPTLGAPARVTVSDTPGRQGDGGPFAITVIQGSLTWLGDDGVTTIQGPSQFETFCIERRESVALPGDYWVQINLGAIRGGDPSEFDPLEKETAALYRQWLAGPLIGYSDSTYQLAMWSLENEAVFDTGDDQWEDAAGNALAGVYQVGQDAVTDLIDTVGNPSDLGNVRVMTLWTSWTEDPAGGPGTFSGWAQDQLVVPVPAAVLLGMLGLTAAGLKLRRFV
jgi:hypothetical protein